MLLKKKEYSIVTVSEHAIYLNSVHKGSGFRKTFARALIFLFPPEHKGLLNFDS